MQRCTHRVVALTISLTAIGAAAAPADAAVLAEWTYETSQPASSGPHEAEGGLFAGPLSVNTVVADATATISSEPGKDSPTALRTTGVDDGDDEDKYLQFRTSSLGHQGITFSFDMGASNTGPRDWKVQYSNDGTTFTDLPGGAFDAPNPVSGWPTATDFGFTFDLSGISALDNQATIYLRLDAFANVQADDVGDVSGSGYIQIDNVLIEGEVVPEPAGLAALGMLALALLCKRR